MNCLILVGVWLCIHGKWALGKYKNKQSTYSNIWVTKVRGGEEIAKRIAEDLGYNYQGQLGQFEDYYKLVREDHPEVSLRESDHLTNSLLDLDEVMWAKQQMWVKPMHHGLWEYTEEAQRAEVKSFLDKESSKSPTDSLSSWFSSILSIPTRIRVIVKSFNQGDLRKLGTFSTKPAPRSQLNEYSSQKTRAIGLISKKISAYEYVYKDPYWDKQWYMQDYRTVDMPVMDLNVVPVHKMSYTGKKVTVAVIDNGIRHEHPEIKDNYLDDLSYDYCTDKPGCPPYDDSHGTNVAGIIGMKPNNRNCGVGIAYDVKIVGINVLCNNYVPEYVSAKAFRHHVGLIDIYSNSWGNPGWGEKVFKMGHLTLEALTKGVKEGRNGNGAIYVRSSGNDKVYDDNCAVDEDLNNEFFIVISGAQQHGKTTYFSERCTAVLAATYTQTTFSEGIVAPNKNLGCYADFTGTSAACPQASAIIALALEANSQLTYRDVMHLITMSAEVAPLADNDGIWYKNGRGFWVSNAFGFGLMNAENMVTLAKKWERVPEKSICKLPVLEGLPKLLSFGTDVEVSFYTSACRGTRDEVNYLEHVELQSIISYTYRGAITIYITSPAGTTSQLLAPRSKDNHRKGLDGLNIMSTHNWGEKPHGKWTVTFKISSDKRATDSGEVTEFKLKLHGTKYMPTHYYKVREYSAFRLPNGQTS